MAATPPAPSPPRILLAGDAHGRLHQLFKRVKSVATPSTYHSLFLLSPVPPVNQSTGPFHALLCVGQFFSPEGDAEGAPGDVADYIEGLASVPIPTYFTGDYGPSAPRLLLKAASGARGFAPGGIEICPKLFWLRGSNRFTLHGLSVVYLSGRKGLGGPGCYSQGDVDALRALAEEPGIVNLFLTYPLFFSLLFLPLPASINIELLWVLDPNGYDPIVAELVAEIMPREPYVNDSAAHVTRFIGLANVGNKEKQCLSGETALRDARPRSERRRVESSCWFCLSSPDVESHLVISIGEGYYCTLAKGPLVPNHVLMIPVEHCPNTLMMPPEAEAELGRYKIALGKYFEKQGKTAVYFEWVSPRSHHANLQVLAGLLSMADRADWRNCKISKEEEIGMVDDFKQGFREFDPVE
ncbi:unnamed protein product [Miscanthus lutarioriparius]|uniref:Cwf19-like C-terminal domain-containing protein n=1 Tax=Miscanthus lutarioriparius TaxID=422564 RepID=A0A811NKC4_9POAL|nr:unnamed protein product [Miscanthus lutarioriparius]